jgi:hypothetical protein
MQDTRTTALKLDIGSLELYACISEAIYMCATCLGSVSSG